MVFELADDFREAWQALPSERPWRQNLRLLEQAVRPHLQFIHRHHRDYPQALFQTLWNEAWWCDCAEAEAHYEAPEEGSEPRQAPWNRQEPKLSKLLEQWRGTVAPASTGVLRRLLDKLRRSDAVHPTRPNYWLRSVRPPRMPVDSGYTLKISNVGGSRDVVFSPDGTRLLTASADGCVYVWDVGTGKQIARYPVFAGGLEAIAISPDGRCIATPTAGQLAVVEVDSGCVVARLDAPVWIDAHIAFSPDGKSLAFSSHRNIHLWRTATWTPEVTFEHELEVKDLAFGPDESTLSGASATEIGNIRYSSTVLWDCLDCRDRAHLVTAPCFVALWDHHFPGYRDCLITCIACSPVERLCIGGSQRGHLHFLAHSCRTKCGADH